MACLKLLPFVYEPLPALLDRSLALNDEPPIFRHLGPALSYQIVIAGEFGEDWINLVGAGRDGWIVSHGDTPISQAERFCSG